MANKPTLYPIQSGADLLQPHSEYINRIRSLVGVEDTQWNTLYARMLERFAELVQECPASEAHHHDERGGLLKHTLDVASKSIDRVAKDLWFNQDDASATRLMIVSLALLHDIAKILTDHIIQLYDVSEDDIGRWCPAIGLMTDHTNAKFYSHTFNPNREYSLHKGAAGLFVWLIVPSEVHASLYGHPQLYQKWLSFNSGQLGVEDDIAQIITLADMTSSAEGMNTEGENMSGKKRLVEHYKEELAAICTDGAVKINKPGGMAFITETDVYFVCKSTIDYIRKNLSIKNVNIPPNNNHVFDDLQNYGLLIAKTDGKAIRKVHIIVSANKEGGSDWAKDLTTFKVSREDLFGDEQVLELKGSIKELDEALATEDEDIPPFEEDSGNKEQTVESEVQSDDIDFWNWVVESLNNGELSYSCPGAEYHFVDEGLLIVSPNAYKSFCIMRNLQWRDIQKKHLKSLRKSQQGLAELETYRIRATGSPLTGVVVQDITAFEPKVSRKKNDLLERIEKAA